jgi:hypothetical protein
MKIDRHNYEEYFLLYVDNELTVEQKKLVELFVQDNPDLEEELVMLQQSRLVPETIVFEQKDVLMKEDHSFINMNNYEEWLVLYVDSELSKEEGMAVEKFAAEHPSVQSELHLFQQTKLHLHEISFPDKNLLYRNKEKANIITLTWWRIAAAAMLVIAAGITLYSIFNKRNDIAVKDRIAVKEQKQTPAESVLPGHESPKQENVNGTLDKQVAITPAPATKPKETGFRKQPAAAVAHPVNNIAKINEAIPQKRQAIANELNSVQSKELQFSGADVTVRDKQIINDKDVTPRVAETPNLPEYASNTENKKFRGLFRKATRFIERTSGINPANDDNRVLIGGMAINLK